jgi:hypothetical protein
MKIFAEVRGSIWMRALGLAVCLALVSLPTVRAQDITTSALRDRAQIQDLITRYYYNFGRSSPESFSDFYADGAELILGTTRFKGKDGIAKAYSRTGRGGPPPKRYSFNVTISNPLIVVHGDTATSQLIYTEFVIEKQGDAPRVTSQGREYATFVKVNGRWLYKTREIKGGNEPPADWKP